MPIKPRTAEDAYVVARRDPRDMAKAILPEVQCQSVIVGPLATASKSQVDSSHRQAEGLTNSARPRPPNEGGEGQDGPANPSLGLFGGGTSGMATGVKPLPGVSGDRPSRTP